MKKFNSILVAVLCAAITLVLVACGNGTTEKKQNPTAPKPVGTTTTTTEKVVNVMSYAEFEAADLDTDVCVETYVQANQSWWNDSITLYCQSSEGAVFVYNAECSEDLAKELVKGTKVKVTGTKSEWKGEVEIMDGKVELVEGGDTYVATATVLNDVFGTDNLIDHQNEYFKVNGQIVASKNAEGGDAAFLYNYDGSGDPDSDADLYFNIKIGDNTFTFTVEYYLCNNTTDVYKAVTGLAIGQNVEVEGFLYWYDGANPHVTSVKVEN